MESEETMKTKRVVYEVGWDKWCEAWVVTRRGKRGRTLYETKEKAIKAARLCANLDLLSQVVIKGKNGRIQTEYTYGKDPRRYKG